MSNKKSLSAAAAAWAPPKKKTVLRAAAAAWAPSFGGNHNAKKEEQKRKEQEEAKRKQEEQKKREAEEKARIEKQKEQERLRREEEKRLEEEERERQRLAEEEARRKQEEEKKRLEEERRQEEERKEKERKIQEQRERERKRKAEERKKRLAQDPNTSTKDRKYSRKYLLQFEELCRAPPKDLDPKFKAAMNNSTIRYSRARSSTGSGGGDQWRNKNSGNRSTSRRTQRDAGYNNYNDKSYNYNNTNRRPNNRRPGKGRNQRNNRNQNSRPMDIEIKELEVTENRYKIVKNKAELEEDELLKRKINSILNKLTPEKFEKLCGQFDQLDINNRERLQWVVDSVFEKALINPIHTPTYADFCKRLAGQGKQFEGNITFKKVLLNCCQQEFEKDHEAERKKIEEKQTEEEKLEAEIKHKQRRIGTIAFIGELFCRGLIGKKIIYVCFNYLLDPEDPDEENVEALCKLFATIGKVLWAKERSQKQKHGKFTLGMVRSLIKSDPPKIKQARIRFLIQDTAELAARGWALRKGAKVTEAKKISEVHAEAEREAQAQQHQNRRNNDRDRFRDRDRRRNDARKQNKVYHNTANRKPKPKNRDADGWSSTNMRVRARNQGRGGGGSTLSMRGRGTPRNQGGRGRMFNRNPNKTPAVQMRQATAFDLLQQEESESEHSTPAPSPQVSANSSGQDPPGIKLEPAIEEAPLSPEEEKKGRKNIKLFISEYFSAQDMGEVKLCIEELGTNQLHHWIVFDGMAMCIEKRERERTAFKTMLTNLVKDSVLTKEHLSKGFDEMMEFADDFAMDFPLLYKVLADWFASVLLCTPSSITLGYLNSAGPQKMGDKGRKKFVVETLSAILAAKGQDALTALVNNDPDFNLSALNVVPLPENLAFLN